MHRKSSFMNRLKEKWQITSNSQLVIIFIVFAITGSTASKIAGPVVHVFGILHHITDVDVGVKEILRVLKPGGSVYAMFYNKNSLLYYHSIMYLRGVVDGEFERGLTEEDLVSKYSEAETGCPYTKIYTEDSVEKLFYDNGFGKVETQIDSPHIDTLEERKVEIKNLPRNLGWHISTKATK